MTDPTDRWIGNELDASLAPVEATPPPLAPWYVAGPPLERRTLALTALRLLASRAAIAAAALVLAGGAIGIKGAATGSFSPFAWGSGSSTVQQVHHEVLACSATAPVRCASEPALVVPESPSPAVLTPLPPPAAPAATPARPAQPAQPAQRPSGSSGNQGDPHGHPDGRAADDGSAHRSDGERGHGGGGD
jgi:hypothetical protein